MLDLFCNVLGAICIVGIFLLYTIGNICFWGRKLFYCIKCFQIDYSSCLNEHCKYRGNCKKAKYTENEIERIQRLIDSLNN